MQRGVASPPGSGPTGPLEILPEGLRVAGASVPLRSAGVAYLELPPGRWEEALDSLASLRVALLRLDLSWASHERAPGVYEWGERLPEFDVGRLLGLAHARGLLAAIRPGPWLGDAACDVPAHLLRVESVAAGPHEPSLISGRLMLEAERWHSEVARIVAPHVYPRGPVVAWMLGTPGGATRPGGLLDRGEDALRFHGRYLELKYPAGRGAAGAPSEAGPRGAGELAGALAWVEAGEAAARAWISRNVALRPGQHPERGVDPIPAIAAVDDHPFGAGADPRTTLGEVDATALPFPRGAAGDWGELRMFGLRAADLGPAPGVLGIPTRRAPLDLPSPFDPPMLLAALSMCGVSAFDLDALPGPDLADDYRRWFRLLDAVEHPALERRSDLLLLQNREAARLREACSPGGDPPGELASPRVLEALRAVPRDLGLRDRPEIDSAISFRALFDGMRRAGIALSVADTSAGPERLARARVALLVGFERIGRPLAERLFEWVAAGGTLISGPRLPELDWEGAPLGLQLPFGVKDRVERLALGGLTLEGVDLLEAAEPVLECDSGVLAASAPFGRGRIVHFGFRLPFDAISIDPERTAQVAAALAAAAGVAPSYAASDPLVETELFVGAVRRFLFLANPTPETREVEIALGEREALREVRGSGVHVRAGERLMLPSHAVLLREVVSL